MPEESVRILITSPIGESCLGQIAKVSQCIEVLDVSELINVEQNGGTLPNGEFDVLLADTEVIFGFDVPQSLLKRAPKLKWIQTISAGIDHLITEDVLASPVIITTIKGMSSTQVAEFVFGVALTFVKRLSFCFQLKQAKQWQKYRTAGLQSKTMGIVGFGHIGSEVARLAKAFGMRVIAIRRSMEKKTLNGNVDILLPMDSLIQLMTESDFVLVSVPLTPETTKLIGEKELRSMKSTAYLINIARGNVIDEESLIHALENDWIAGAGLDVFTEEPLPAESRLWELPNVILSPHVSGDTEDEYEQATAFFIENLKNYLDGNNLINMVDKKKMY